MLHPNSNILELINTINCVELGIQILQTLPTLNWMGLIHSWGRFEWAQHGYDRQDNFLVSNSAFFSNKSLSWIFWSSLYGNRTPFLYATVRLRKSCIIRDHFQMEEQQLCEVIRILSRHHSPFVLQLEPLFLGGIQLLFLQMRSISLLHLDLSIYKT